MIEPIISKNIRVRHPEHFSVGEGSIVDDFCYFSTSVTIGKFSHIASGCTVAGLMDFGTAFLVLLGMMVYYGMPPTMAVVTLPLFILLAVATALAVGLWLSAMNVQYRDVRYTIPFLTQFWLFITPIAYPSSLVPEGWRVLYGLNPMAGVVEGFRWALLGTANAPGPCWPSPPLSSSPFSSAGSTTSATWRRPSQMWSRELGVEEKRVESVPNTGLRCRHIY